MNLMRITRPKLFLAIVVVAGACTADDPPAMGNVDASMDDAPQPCATLAPSPNTISETQMTTTYPTPMGGSIVDGTYYLSRFEIYPNASADSNTRANRLEIRGGILTSVNRSNNGAAEIKGGTVLASGTTLSVTITCPTAAVAAVMYTAAAGELWLFDPSEPNVQVYSRQ